MVKITNLNAVGCVCVCVCVFVVFFFMAHNNSYATVYM